ncbi:MAG: NlpC/P60 family protein [bacterium]
MKKKIVSLLLTVSMVLGCVTPVLADHESDVRSQQAEAQSALNSTISQIDVDASISASLDAEIVDLDTQVVEMMASIGLLEEDISSTEGQIKEKKKELKAANAKRDAQEAGMKARIQYLYENGQSLSFLSYLLSADDLEDFLNRVSYTQDLSQYDRDQLLAYEQSIKEIESIKTNLENSRSILQEEKLSLDDQKQSLETALSEKKQQSANYKAEVEALRSRAAELTAQIAAQNAELRQIEEQKRIEEERRRQAEEEERRRQEAEAERLRQESIAAEKARQEAEAAEKARLAAEAEEKARKEAEAAEQRRKEAEAVEKARLAAEAEEKARKEAEAAEKARQEAEAKAAADAAAKAEAERAQKEAEEKAAAAERARQEAEAAERARQEAEAAEKARQEAEEKERREAEAAAAEAARRAAEEAAKKEQSSVQEPAPATPTPSPVPQSSGIYSDGRALSAAAQANSFYQSTGCMYQTGARPGPNAAYATDNANIGVQIADFAVQFNGIPYVSCGADLVTGCDCSGFVHAVYKHFGVDLIRDPNLQGHYGRAVSLAEAKPGDIVVYMGHSAIYIGNNTIINASEPGVGVVIRSPVAYRQIVTIRRLFDY